MQNDPSPNNLPPSRSDEDERKRLVDPTSRRYKIYLAHKRRKRRKDEPEE